MNATIDNAIESLGLDYTAEFIPFSQSKNYPGWKSFNWRITLKAHGVTLTTTYAQGVGCLADEVAEWLKRTQGGPNTVDGAAAIDYMVEKGVYGMYPRSLPDPKLKDVLGCLVLDSDALEHPDFESWASNLGFDTDSRKAEATYGACLETGLKLRAMFGDDKLEELRELFQDY